jgi:hypothetical protein
MAIPTVIAASARLNTGSKKENVFPPISGSHCGQPKEKSGK